MDYQFETPRPVELYVELDRGNVAITSSDTTESHIRVEGEQPERLRVNQTGDAISAVVERRSFFDFAAGLSVWITVPIDSTVVVKTGSADVQTVGRLASAAVNTGSGDAEVADTAGVASVKTGSGEVRIGSAGRVQVKTGSGAVSVGESVGEAGVVTGSGAIELGLAHARAVLKSGSGDISVDSADGDLNLNTASGSVEVARVRYGDITVSTVSGSASIGVPTGVPVWTDISTVTGRLDSDLRGAGRPEPGQDSLKLRVKTVSGGVRLVQLEGLDLR